MSTYPTKHTVIILSGEDKRKVVIANHLSRFAHDREFAELQEQ
jgi:hypothetical protein